MKLDHSGVVVVFLSGARFLYQGSSCWFCDGHSTGTGSSPSTTVSLLQVILSAIASNSFISHTERTVGPLEVAFFQRYNVTTEIKKTHLYNRIKR